MKEELKKIHQAKSQQKFPGVDLEEGEFVEVYIERSRKGLLLIWAGEVVGFVILTIILVMLLSGGGRSMLFPLNDAAVGYLYLVVVTLYLVLLLSGWVGTMIYRANHLIVTNKRVMQRSTTSLFARSVNVIDLSSVEDVSFAQSNIFDQVFGIGTIRMSTVGDETTYTLSFVDTPTDEIKKIAKLVHEVKKR